MTYNKPVPFFLFDGRLLSILMMMLNEILFFFFMFGRLLHLKFVRGGFELLRSGNAVHRLPIPQRSQLLWRRRHHVRQYVYSLNHLSLVFSCRILSESPPLQTIVVLCLSFSCRMKIVYDCFIHFSILFSFFLLIYFLDGRGHDRN